MCISAAACRRFSTIWRKYSEELVNVAEDPAYLAIRLEMAERLLAWRAEHLDQSLALVELTEDGICGRVPSLI